MVDYGVTALGFTLKRLEDIKSDLVTALSTITDPVSGETLTPDLEDEDDPLIQVVNAFSDSLAEAWEHLQSCYNQFDPLRSSGAGLTGVVQLNGLRRRAGSRSLTPVIITGTPNTIIPVGSRISTVNDVPIFELPALQIGSGGTVVGIASCIDDGPVVANVASLVKIMTPISGWTAVTNTSEASLGTYEETDEELRARQQISTSATAQTIIEAISSGIGELAGVEFVKMYQNITLLEDDRGIPAKCIAPVVQGGDDDEIAQVLYQKLAAGGADSFGSTEVSIVDNQGIPYTLRFTRPAAVDIYIEVELTVVNENVWPTNGEDLIKAAIIAWASLGASGLNISSATQYDQDGYLPGQSVYATELMIPCYSVGGVQINSIVIGTTESPSGSEVVIDWDEVATFDSANITVTVN